MPSEALAKDGIMWSIPALTHELVSIVFSPDAITCSWIQKTKTATAPLIVRAYKKYPLHNLELYNLIPFNLTSIKKHIRSFLCEHGLQDAFVIFCLDGIAEKCVALPTSTPHCADFNMPTVSSIQWEYRYLYSDHDGHYIFYVYALPRSLILQYELLAIGLCCNLIGIATKTAALLDAYKNIFGAAFRKSQLAIDMMRHDNDIQALITDDAVRRMVSFSGGIAKEDYSTIAAACGMFCAERIE